MVQFVVYVEKTTEVVRSFKSFKAADNYAKKHTSDVRPLAAVAEEFWQLYIRHTRRVKNLMTQQWVDEPSDTPWFCSVASETYWSA